MGKASSLNGGKGEHKYVIDGKERGKEITRKTKMWVLG
jgi:hypothetical protein